MNNKKKKNWERKKITYSISLKTKVTDPCFGIEVHLTERKKEKILISAGGVMNEKEVQARLLSGADLVQCYSALVFSGPQFFNHSLEKLKLI